jgi:hypothetical protein
MGEKGRPPKVEGGVVGAIMSATREEMDVERERKTDDCALTFPYIYEDRPFSSSHAGEVSKDHSYNWLDVFLKITPSLFWPG